MNFIETRKKLLENFLKELKNLEYLHYSEEMQEFLRGPPNFYQSERIEKSVNFNVIAEKYRELFSEFEGISRNAEVEKEISGLLGELNIGLRNFERIYLQCEENFSVIKEMQWKMCRFKEIVGEIKDFYGDPQEENISKESISNPYAELADWCRGNFLNVSGLIDCIYQQYELQRQKNALIEKIGEKQLEIQKLLKGKKTMAQYFYKKPKEFYIGKTETEISQMKENVTSINCILNFSSALVLKQYYPLFKYQKKEEFNSLVGATNGKHLKIFLVFSDYFKDI